MQLVTLLILPSALLSVQLLGFATDANVPGEVVVPYVDWPAIVKMWMVVGCFGLASRWLEKAQHLSSNTIEQATCYSPVWLIQNRESLLLWLWCLTQPVCLVASGWNIERPFQRMRFGPAATSPAQPPFAVAGPEFG